MKTLAQQYQDLLTFSSDFIKSASSSVSEEKIENFLRDIFEDFANENLPKCFTYEFKYSGINKEANIECSYNSHHEFILAIEDLSKLGTQVCTFKKILDYESSEILFENDEFNSFIENNCTPILDFGFDCDNNIYIYDYNEGITAFKGQIFNESLFRDIIKLGMYIERRNQLNKIKKYDA